MICLTGRLLIRLLLLFHLTLGREIYPENYQRIDDTINSPGEMLALKNGFNHQQAESQSREAQSHGNVCKMRITVDRFPLETYDNNEERLEQEIKTHEDTLNEVYKNNSVKVTVGKEKMQLKFKVVEIIFRDKEYCGGNESSGS